MTKATSVLLEDELRQLDDYYGMIENDELDLDDLEMEILDFDAISLEDMYTGAKTVNEGENDNIMERSTEDIREVEIITKFVEDTLCRDNNVAIMRNINMPDETKTEKLKQAINHLEEANIQRKFYNDIRKDASVALTQAKQLEQKPGIRVFSIDYAQNIHYPSSEMQVGPAFFKTARKCGIFGINDEADNTQTNYLIDECDNIGKGANSVINLIHHHLESNNCDQDNQHICADNCVGQNKNNAVVHYCAWRVASELNKTVHLNFLLVGHTKFSPDRMFGLLKQKFSKSTVDTLHDIEECVANSTVSGKNKAICTNDYVNGIINVQWYEWNAFLSEFFTTIPGITQYHHFIIKSDDPFTVECKVLANNPVQKFNIVKKGVTLDDITGMPNLLVPPGLSLARQWYLFEEIAPLCTSKDAANLTCPKPQKAKPTSQMAKVDQPGPSAKKTRKVTTCGHCKEPGHTIRSCKQNKK
ncbi:unnamed protein product [Chilo suppressalis]|uniref:DUF7869 domain-containing protein n=1 Tax=Chilo suppressalis TaxID=168631 RepID=A0ABN8B3S1_CHISP|nr:unnamed protein product [Chilo suppressalis]